MGCVMKNIKQQLGLKYSEENPVSYIISRRLAYIWHLQRDSAKFNIFCRHMDNLELTYGYETVQNVVKAIYGKAA